MSPEGHVGRTCPPKAATERAYKGTRVGTSRRYLPYLPIPLPPDKVVEMNQDDPPQFDPVGVRRGVERRASTSQDDQARSSKLIKMTPPGLTR